VDPGRDQACQQDRDDKRPRCGKEPETNPQLPLNRKHRQKHWDAHSPSHVPSTPRHRRFRRAEPHLVDPIHIVIGPDAHCAVLAQLVNRPASHSPTSTPRPLTASPISARATTTPPSLRMTPALSPLLPPNQSKSTATAS